MLSAWVTLFGLAQTMVLARFLLPADFGVLAFFAILLTICNVFVRVGFSDVIISNQNMSEIQLSTLYWVNVLVGLVAYLVLVASAPLISIAVQHDQIQVMTQVIGLSLIFGCVTVQFEALARKRLDFRFLAFLGMLEITLSLVVAVYLAASGHGIWSLIYSAVASQAVRSITLMIYARNNSLLPAMMFCYREVSEFVRLGLLRVGASLVNNLNSRSDQMAIAVFLGPVALGYYSLGYNIAMMPFQKINPILTQISFPVFARVVESKPTLLSGYRKGVRLLMLINAPILLGYIVIAPKLVPLIMGPGWDPVVIVSQILAVCSLLRSAGGINIGLILAHKKYHWPLYWNLFLLFLIPAAILIVSATSGSLVKVSITLVGIQICLFVMSYFLFARPLLGPFGRDYVMDMVRPVSAAIMMAASVAWLGSFIDFVPEFAQLVILIAFGVLTYFLSSLFTQKLALLELRRIAIPNE